ncbi:hypothetical protein evm_004921 [Chilo suppressalis]|nr:hypothetical protein evm_004921 [Chilo suppressalis]
MDSDKSKLPDDQPQTNPPPYAGANDPVQVQPVAAVAAVAYVTPVNTVMVQAVPPMGSKPSHITCRSCHTQITTRIENKYTTRTHLFALGMCAVGLWCCCCIPYCMDSCQSIDHYCPNCDAYIGTSR